MGAMAKSVARQLLGMNDTRSNPWIQKQFVTSDIPKACRTFQTIADITALPAQRAVYKAPNTQRPLSWQRQLKDIAEAQNCILLVSDVKVWTAKNEKGDPKNVYYGTQAPKDANLQLGPEDLLE